MKKQNDKKQKITFQDLLYKHITKDKTDIALDNDGHVRVKGKASQYISLRKN